MLRHLNPTHWHLHNTLRPENEYNYSHQFEYIYGLPSSQSRPIITPPKIWDSYTNDSNPWIYGNSVALVATYGFSKLYIYDIPSAQLDDVGYATNQPQMNDDYLSFDYSRSAKVYNRTTAVTKSLGGSAANTYLSGQYVSWIENTDNAHADILHLYDASDSSNTPQVIANNVDYLDAPSIDGNLIVYSGWDGNDLEIYVYEIDTATTTQLTSNQFPDEEPKVSGDRIAWEQNDGTDKEIMLATRQSGSAQDDCSYYVVPVSKDKTSIFCL